MIEAVDGVFESPVIRDVIEESLELPPAQAKVREQRQLG